MRNFFIYGWTPSDSLSGKDLQRTASRPIAATLHTQPLLNRFLMAEHLYRKAIKRHKSRKIIIWNPVAYPYPVQDSCAQLPGHADEAFCCPEAIVHSTKYSTIEQHNKHQSGQKMNKFLSLTYLEILLIRIEWNEESRLLPLSYCVQDAYLARSSATGTSCCHVLPSEWCHPTDNLVRTQQCHDHVLSRSRFDGTLR